jgi:diadenylate cyclase
LDFKIDCAMPAPTGSTTPRSVLVLPTLAEIRVTDVIDVAIVSALLWTSIAWLRASRARVALLGLALLGALYWVVQQLHFQLTSWLLQGFFAVVVLILIVVFQDDLRRLFERIATWGLRRQAPRLAPTLVGTLVRAVAALAAERTGALIVLTGREPLDRHLDGGTFLKGRVSEPLLLSLFDASSPGHDGAVVLEGPTVTRFGVHLPLSNDWDRLDSHGTRHAAALGLAERTDALCIAVSEERGTISLGHDGELKVVRGADQLAPSLEDFVSRSERDRGPLRAKTAPRRMQRWGEGAVAIAMAATLWFVTVPGATLARETRVVPIVVENMPAGYQLAGVDPPRVEVVVQGRRRDLYLARDGSLEVQLDALLVQLGRRTFEVSADQVSHPTGLEIAEIHPGTVKLAVKRLPAS